MNLNKNESMRIPIDNKTIGYLLVYSNSYEEQIQFKKAHSSYNGETLTFGEFKQKYNVKTTFACVKRQNKKLEELMANFKFKQPID